MIQDNNNTSAKWYLIPTSFKPLGELRDVIIAEMDINVTEELKAENGELNNQMAESLKLYECQNNAIIKLQAENKRLLSLNEVLVEALKEAMDIIDRMDEQYRDATDKHSSFTRGEFNRLTAAIEANKP